MEVTEMDKIEEFINSVDEIYAKIDNDNWREMAVKDLDSDDKAILYLEKYIAENGSILDLSWAKNFRKFLFLWYNDEYKEYASVYYNILGNYPDNYFVEQAMGEYYYKAKPKLLRSREHFKKAEALLPEISKPKAQLGLIYSALGDSEKAYRYYEEAYNQSCDEQIAVKQIQSQSLLNMGIILIQSSKRKEGRELVRKALKIRPDYEYAKQILRTS
ncbi:hypothetical protein C4544_03605 [candidate division WS5 bacterium]|uniref:Uncharacterized protein n=1 Tax=candidate division WS5 bacterium TaxID=2093353 RepID=A0A419DDM9_9BACT|nr:MAG: hypothetical protein C4544_03605 [candidate division WS5 bacterium]